MKWLIVTLVVLMSGVSCVHRASSPQSHYHKVKVRKGDSIRSLATRYRTTPQIIARDNRLSPKNPLKIGQTVFIRKVKSRTARRSKSRSGGFFFGQKKSYPKPTGTAKTLISWPIAGKMTSPFGMRNGRPHHGIDISAHRGTDIAAAASGKVTFSGWQRGYGRTVIVTHASGRFKTLYAHLNTADVKKGDWVNAGEVIGEVGATGRATGPHLHFELRDKRDIPVNPIPYLKGRSKPKKTKGFLYGSL